MQAFKVIDFATAEGHKLAQHLQQRLEELRAQLEDPAASNDKTQQTRGAIREIRALLAERPQTLVSPRYSGAPGRFTKQGSEA